MKWQEVSVRLLPDTALCVVTAEYSRGGWAERDVTVRVPVGSEVKLIQLRPEDVVSHAERGRKLPRRFRELDGASLLLPCVGSRCMDGQPAVGWSGAAKST